MTLLGKIFTALIFVASLVCLTIAVMVFASHKNWEQVAVENKQKYESLKRSLDAAREAKAALEKDIEKERVARAMAIAQLASKYEIRSEEVTQKEDELASQTQMAQNSLARMQDALARLRELESQLATARSTNTDLRTNLHETLTEVVALASDNQNMEAQLANQEERFGQMSNEIALMNKVMTANGLDKYFETWHIPPKVDGRITAVSQANQGLLEISLGSDDGIRVGHMLDIYRGPEYLGRVRIIETAPNQAVGELIENLTRGPIKEDDRVTTKLRG